MTVAMGAAVTYILPDTKRHHNYVCQLDLTLFQVPEMSRYPAVNNRQAYFIFHLIYKNSFNSFYA